MFAFHTYPLLLNDNPQIKKAVLIKVVPLSLYHLPKKNKGCQKEDYNAIITP
tara:strand:+ start:589 stop:744 length:156 start_codon:yes stop_codon:yes gene_type:complete